MYGYKWFFAKYAIKIYDKSKQVKKQYRLDIPETLRLEITGSANYLNKSFLKLPFDLTTENILQAKTLKALEASITNTINQITAPPDTESNLTAKEITIMALFNDPIRLNLWKRKVSRNTLNRSRKVYNEVLKNYTSESIQILAAKWQEILSAKNGNFQLVV